MCINGIFHVAGGCCDWNYINDASSTSTIDEDALEYLDPLPYETDFLLEVALVMAQINYVWFDWNYAGLAQITWICLWVVAEHYSDVIMGAMVSQIISVSIVYSTVRSGADQRKHQSSSSLTFVRGIHRWPVNSPHTGPVTRKMFPFENVIMIVSLTANCI